MAVSCRQSLNVWAVESTQTSMKPSGSGMKIGMERKWDHTTAGNWEPGSTIPMEQNFKS